MKERDSLRPTDLEDYIGQEHIKDLLSTAVLSAKMRKEPLDHVLLNGPPGLGKTTLALIIAGMMERNLKTIIGPSLGSPKDVVKLVMSLDKNTDIFIDEVHRVRKTTQEVLYPLLEDGTLYSTLTRSSTKLEIPPLTILGATTNIGKLEQPFIDRFGLQFQLEYYNVDELSSILLHTSEKLKISVDWDVVDEVARRSRGTPRIANNIMKRLRDYSVVGRVAVTQEFASEVITKKLHIDAIGLKPLDYRYLRALRGCPDGVGVTTIAATINEEVPTIEDFVEPYLLSLGFISRERSGRCLTEKGSLFLTQKGS